MYECPQYDPEARYREQRAESERLCTETRQAEERKYRRYVGGLFALLLLAAWAAWWLMSRVVEIWRAH